MTVTTEDVLFEMAHSSDPRLHSQIADGIINPIVLARFLGIRNQMVYTYIKQGKIRAYKLNNTQKIVIDLGEAVAFAQKYLERQRIRQEQIEAQLAGGR